MGVNVVIILTLLPALALLPKARAGCSNSARPDPCGGPPARAVPTATIVPAPTSFLPRVAGEDEGGGLNGEPRLNDLHVLLNSQGGILRCSTIIYAVGWTKSMSAAS